jgi:hypothetical protein
MTMARRIFASPRTWCAGWTLLIREPSPAVVIDVDRRIGWPRDVSDGHRFPFALTAAGRTLAWECTGSPSVVYHTIGASRKIDTSRTIAVSDFGGTAYQPITDGNSIVYCVRNAKGALPYAIYRCDLRSGASHPVVDSRAILASPAIDGSTIAWRESVPVEGGQKYDLSCSVVVDRDGHIDRLDHATSEEYAPVLSKNCVLWLGQEEDRHGKKGKTAIWVAMPPTHESDSIFSP